ncbi:MAG: response regulator transcription factor [Rhodobacter sp.]|nr:response regulator transcription factor [Rhodobacter sp.]
MGATILIVDDDVALGAEVEDALVRAGYATRRALDVPDARRTWSELRADLCIVDIVMPGPSGKVFCREIRERSDAAIIVMSSLSDEDTIIALLDIGADDYLIKPFSMPELKARIRAVLRRRSLADGADAVTHATKQIGEWTFDLQLRRLSKPDGLTVPLTQSEASVLRFLSQSPGIIFSREDILAVGRSRQYSGKDDRAVDTLIKRLRRKVEVNPADPRHILTEWGKGYRFEI